MSREAHIAKLRQAIVSCEAQAVEEAKQVNLDAFALVRKRIIETGINSAGEKIPGYSEAVVPFWYFKGRGRSEKNLDRLKKKKGYFVSYRDFRQFNNLQVDHVDFFVKGELWGSFEAVELRKDGQTIVFITQPKDEPNKKKLGYTIEQKGDWMALNTEEERLLAEIAEERQVTKLKKIGL